LGRDGSTSQNRQALNQQFPQRQRALGRSNQAAQTQPASGNSSGQMGWLLQTLAALGVVIGLIFLTRWGWFKLSGQQPANTTGARAVEVLARTAVAPKNRVLLRRIGQRILVVGDSAQGLNPLTAVEDPQEVADLLTAVTQQQQDSATNNFRQMMGRVSGRFDQSAWAREQGRDDSEHTLDRSREELASLLSRVRAMTNRGASR
jgi:flagellar biogenesis protein FliO